MNNLFSRRAVSPAIVLLVLAAVSLSILALFYFNNVHNQLEETTFLHTAVIDVEEKRFLLHFYTQDIFERSVIEQGKSMNHEAFIETFKKNAATYIYTNGSYFVTELAQLETLGVDAVSFRDGEINLQVNFIIIDERDRIKIKYEYEELFWTKLSSN